MSDAPPLPPPSNDTMPPPRRRPGLAGFIGGVAGGLVAAIALMAVAALLWPAVRDRIVPPQKSYDTAVGDLDRRIAALEGTAGSAAAAAATDRAALADLGKRLAALEQAVHAPPPEDPRLAALAEKVDQIAGQVAALHAPAQTEADMQQLVARAEAAAQSAKSTAAQRQSAEALLVVVGQLRDAVERGSPYDAELAAARKVAPAEAGGALDVLAATSASGIPPRTALVNTFPSVAAAISRVGLLGSVTEGFWGRIEAEANKLVTVRRVDGQGSDPSSVAARAEKDVQQGDFESAVKELASLQGAPAGEAKAWLDAARLYLNAQHALSDLAAKTAAAVKPAE